MFNGVIGLAVGIAQNYPTSRAFSCRSRNLKKGSLYYSEFGMSPRGLMSGESLGIK